MARTYILTASPDNHAVTAEHGFEVIGLKERRRNPALAVEAGDRFVLYLTQVMAFAGSIRIAGEMFEDRTPLWPGKPGKAEDYRWRFPTEPEVIVEEPEWVPAASFLGALEHLDKWPREHWKLAFQGQIRPVSEHDADVLVDRLRAAAAAPAGA